MWHIGACGCVWVGDGGGARAVRCRVCVCERVCARVWWRGRRGLLGCAEHGSSFSLHCTRVLIMCIPPGAQASSPWGGAVQPREPPEQQEIKRNTSHGKCRQALTRQRTPSAGKTADGETTQGDRSAQDGAASPVAAMAHSSGKLGGTMPLCKTLAGALFSSGTPFVQQLVCLFCRK